VGQSKAAGSEAERGWGEESVAEREAESGESGVGFGREGERDGRACRDCMRDVSAKCPSRRVFRAGGSNKICMELIRM
jgi:hypothetical protein